MPCWAPPAAAATAAVAASGRPNAHRDISVLPRRTDPTTTDCQRVEPRPKKYSKFTPTAPCDRTRTPFRDHEGTLRASGSTISMIPLSRRWTSRSRPSHFVTSLCCPLGLARNVEHDPHNEMHCANSTRSTKRQTIDHSRTRLTVPALGNQSVQITTVADVVGRWLGVRLRPGPPAAPGADPAQPQPGAARGAVGPDPGRGGALDTQTRVYAALAATTVIWCLSMVGRTGPPCGTVVVTFWGSHVSAIRATRMRARMIMRGGCSAGEAHRHGRAGLDLNDRRCNQPGVQSAGSSDGTTLCRRRTRNTISGAFATGGVQLGNEDLQYSRT